MSSKNLQRKNEQSVQEKNYQVVQLVSHLIFLFFFENRDKIKNEIKAITSKGDSESDDRRKEIAALKNQVQKDREELRGQMENDTTMVLKQLEKDSGT